MSAETMRIKMLDDYRADGEVFYKDDTRTVPYGFGHFLATNGFAEDMSGAVPTGEKPTGPKRLKPEDVYTKGG